MNCKRATTLSLHRYDPLDRIAAQTVNGASVQRFYQQGRLVTETDSAEQRSVLRVDDQPLAVQTPEQRRLLVTDQPGTVLQALGAEQSSAVAYTPYGFCVASSGVQSMLGFNGERPDPITGHYLLGNGYRAFNPVTLRCNSADSLSPFDRGGLNAYAAYMNNPISYVDRDGHSVFSAFRALFGIKSGLTVASKQADQLPTLFKASKSGKSTLYAATEADKRNLSIVISARAKDTTVKISDELITLRGTPNLLQAKKARALGSQVYAAFGSKRASSATLNRQAQEAQAYVDALENGQELMLTRLSKKRLSNEATLYVRFYRDQRAIRRLQDMSPISKRKAPKGQRYQWEQ
ncbi:RHS repeat-associated core domain-containing protein [Pseudomonas sp. SDI]|uniref:RHS repeat-associated core domain-containing protein n=1 Tax=Pseudomonas sp. SDI TaxID=2170734 RepID=UPI001057710A|nr:RHS repeat-associated core domain-containing protein [Pseudomonas sp. SDI]